MNPVKPLEQFPGIDYFDQELVNLYNQAWHHVNDNWGSLPLDVQLLLHPYTNNVFGPVSVSDPIAKMAPFTDWVAYQWFNRTGDRPGMVQLNYQIQEERSGKRQPISAMAHIARYVSECNDTRYEDAFPHKSAFYKARSCSQAYWSPTAQTLIGTHTDIAEFLLSECASVEQAHQLYCNVFGKRSVVDVRPREFFFICKGLEKYGFITEVRTLCLNRLYSMLDAGIQTGYDALIVIVLMIENVIGVHISEWRKNIDWLIPDMEEMRVSHITVRGAPFGLSLHKTGMKWAVHVECDKEYMITVNAVGIERKTFRSLYGECVVPI